MLPVKRTCACGTVFETTVENQENCIQCQIRPRKIYPPINISEVEQKEGMMRKNEYEKLDPERKKIHKIKARIGYYKKRGDTDAVTKLEEEIAGLQLKSGTPVAHKCAVAKSEAKPVVVTLSRRDLFSVLEEVMDYGCESITLRRGKMDVTCKLSKESK